MIKWKEAELGEYCDFQEGYVNPSKEHPEYFGGSVKWCRAVDINDGYIYHTSQTLTEEGFKSAKKSALLFEPNTIVISKSGTIGRVGIIKDYMCGNRATINIKPKNNADVEFIFYMLKSKQREFADLAVGSVQKNLYVSILEKIKFKFPSLDNQKKISSYISTIDKKIEINNQINRNLSEQAMALYKKMTIDASEECIEGVLSDVAEIVMGQSPKGDTYNEDGDGTVFYQGRAEFGDRFPTRRLFTSAPKRLAKENTVLISVRAPVGDVNVAYEECCIGRGLCSVGSKDNHQSFVLYTMYSLKDQFDIYNGEGTVFGSINKDSMNGMSIQIPNKALMDKFEEIVSPMDAVIKANYEENCRLIAMRDNLLCKLMSGELDVSGVNI